MIGGLQQRQRRSGRFLWGLLIALLPVAAPQCAAGDWQATSEALGRRMGQFSAYLDKAFRARLGMSVREAAQQIRMDRVKECLSTGNRSMTEIALECGFTRSSHLAFLFKKATGRTMLQWRRENRETQDE